MVARFADGEVRSGLAARWRCRAASEPAATSADFGLVLAHNRPLKLANVLADCHRAPAAAGRVAEAIAAGSARMLTDIWELQSR